MNPFSKKLWKYLGVIGIAVFVLALFTADSTVAKRTFAKTRLSGSIFTLAVDDNKVNQNHFDTKNDVYLGGGPRTTLPRSAGLPEGNYVFQVTDPAGTVLLSQDPAKCRIVEINSEGVISGLVLPADIDPSLSNSYQPVFSPEEPVSCHSTFPADGRHTASPEHDSGLAVQLMPYLLTPDPDGVYKAWITPLDDYLSNGGDLGTIPSDRGAVQDQGAVPDPGFITSRSKIDTFKVYAEDIAQLCKNVENIINSFDINDPSSFNAVEGLVDLGPDAIPCLLYQVQYGGIYHKWAGIYALSRTGSGLPTAEQETIQDIINVLGQELASDALSIRLMAASVNTLLGDKKAIPVLIELLQEDGILLKSEPPSLICQHAFDTLGAYLPVSFGQKCSSGVIDTGGYNSFVQWWDDNRDDLQWDPGQKRYELP